MKTRLGLISVAGESEADKLKNGYPLYLVNQAEYINFKMREAVRAKLVDAGIKFKEFSAPTLGSYYFKWQGGKVRISDHKLPVDLYDNDADIDCVNNGLGTRMSRATLIKRLEELVHNASA